MTLLAGGGHRTSIAAFHPKTQSEYRCRCRTMAVVVPAAARGKVGNTRSVATFKINTSCPWRVHTRRSTAEVDSHTLCRRTDVRTWARATRAMFAYHFITAPSHTRLSTRTMRGACFAGDFAGHAAPDVATRIRYHTPRSNGGTVLGCSAWGIAMCKLQSVSTFT